MAFLAVVVLVLLSPSASLSQRVSGTLKAHFIDVGQGDAILVISPDRDCVLLIDSGSNRYPQSTTRFRQHMLKELPKDHEIDLVVASHPHSDHIGNMRWVLQNYRVKTFIDNGHEVNTPVYRDLMAEVAKQEKTGLRYFVHTVAPPEDQDFCAAENLDSELLYPREGYDADFCQKKPNNCSVVVKLTYGETSFLFPGDADKEQEELLLKDKDIRKKLLADVLKAGNHGSDTASSGGFLRAVSPKWVVISVGRKGVGSVVREKHPRLGAVSLLQEIVGASAANRRVIDVFDGAKWVGKTISGNLFVTAKDGTVVLGSDGRKISPDPGFFPKPKSR